MANINSTPHNLFSVPDLSSETNRDALSGQGAASRVLLHSYHSPIEAHELMAVANALVNAGGKGIYATDVAMEGTTECHFNDEENRERGWRWKEAAYAAMPSDYISGVILESLLDFKLAHILSGKGIIPGVRAEGELVPIPRSEEEFIVQGIEDLLARLQAARIAGARFSKWRVPIACSSVSTGFPSPLSLEIQAETLAQYAAISQQAGLVPIVDLDVEFSRDADLGRSTEVHEKAIEMIYERMRAHGVLLEGSLIKPSFPQPGLEHPSRGAVTPDQIALATATVISRSVPIAVPGVLFLFGELLPLQYLAALNALILAAPSNSPFTRLPALTFSYGRALPGGAMKSWIKGDEEGTKAAIINWSKTCWHAARGEVM